MVFFFFSFIPAGWNKDKNLRQKTIGHINSSMAIVSHSEYLLLLCKAVIKSEKLPDSPFQFKSINQQLYFNILGEEIKVSLSQV